MKRSSKNLTNLMIVLVGFLMIGYLDYITGNEIRLFPLYFLPLAKAAVDFGKKGAIIASIFASIIWLVAQYSSGREYSSWTIWGINFIAQGTVFVLLSLLVASLRTSLDRARQLSLTDQLTGLLNSRALYEFAGNKLTLCHRNKRPVVMAYIDLDNFKQVNDTLGHDRGDSLLRKVADFITSSLRSRDLVARMGGDEFVIFLPEIEAEQAYSILDRIREKILHIPDLDGLQVSASIGAVAFANPPANLQEIITLADNHMFAVKKSGKNRVNIQSVAAEN